MALSDIIQFARHRAAGKFGTSGYGFIDATASSLAILNIASTLQQANWAEVGFTYSQTTVTFPLVIPTIGGGAVGGGVALAALWAGYSFFFYNPGAGQVPPPTYTDPFGHIWPVSGVPVDASTVGTLSNLAAAMSMNGFIGSVSGSTVVVLTALVPGP